MRRVAPSVDARGPHLPISPHISPYLPVWTHETPHATDTSRAPVCPRLGTWGVLGCGMCEPETQTRRTPGTKGENFSSTTSLRTILRERRFRFSVCTCAVPREQSHSHTWLLDAVLT